MSKFIMIRRKGWYWFLSGKEDLLVPDQCGKWTCYFDDQEAAITICQKAIKDNICYECKCRDIEEDGKASGIICFYLNGNDMKSHRKVIEFMIQNDLLSKTKTGRYSNQIFSYDSKQADGTKIRYHLNEFIDLQTGSLL